MQIVESVKKHPYLFGGVVIAAIVIILIIRSSSQNAGAVEVSAAPQGSVETGTALQVASMQAASQASALQAQVQDDQIKANANLAIADLQGKYATNIATINANVAVNQIDAQREVAVTQSTLAAQIQGQQIESAKIIQLGNFQNQQAIQQINADLQKNIYGTLTQSQIATQKESDAHQQAMALIQGDITKFALITATAR